MSNAQDFGNEFLGSVVEWVSNKYNIGDLYSENDIIDYARGTWCPDDIFDDKELDKWARKNGYHTKDDCPAPDTVVINISATEDLSKIDTQDE